MKKSIKRLITVFAVCAVSAFAVVASGCNVTDKIKEKIEQARCEHEWNDGEVTKEATCTEKGELTKTCTLCEKVETEEIELAEHIAVYVQAVTPTCLEKGVTDGTVCSVCETKISGFQEIPALGHIVVKDSAVKATCLEDGLTDGEHCSRCNEVLKVQEKVPAMGHSLVEVPEQPALGCNDGYTSGVRCESCGNVYSGLDIIEGSHMDDDGNGVCDACAEFIAGFDKDLVFAYGNYQTSEGLMINTPFRVYEGDMLKPFSLYISVDGDDTFDYGSHLGEAYFDYEGYLNFTFMEKEYRISMADIDGVTVIKGSNENGSYATYYIKDFGDGIYQHSSVDENISIDFESDMKDYELAGE